ncbi:nicotinamidase-related amidase [Rhizomicrobium palustre]|uniref:Nicotinamidase-related amidase n=1 Tax=Rhizomicrobium palustre TaxID=189966 RepID=A0A846N5X1_9PROT|nr:isochorismatase family protein [Rhizomicrobium palustre]NIK90427.1 nicotinamidase-related amidase [Rhizomicrobium palustre]
MPITAIDPKTALVVIDLQKGIVAMAQQEVTAPVVARAARLAEAFRAKNLPVVLVHVVPSSTPRRADQSRAIPQLPPDFAEILPALNPQPGDHQIEKHSWGAFTKTGLEEWLRANGVTQIVLCGVSTSIGVETTARQAFEAGFDIAFAIDAMADLVPAAHDNSLTRIFPRLGETGTVQEILDVLKGASA